MCMCMCMYMLDMYMLYAPTCIQLTRACACASRSGCCCKAYDADGAGTFSHREFVVMFKKVVRPGVSAAEPSHSSTNCMLITC